MGLQIVRDLLAGGNGPPALDLFYNGTVDAESVTKRYKGSWVKLMDIDDVDHGWWFTWGGGATALENTFGILGEDQPATGNYWADSTTYGMVTRKIYPVFPTTVIRGEYGQYDDAGTDNTDTGATATAASTTFTAAATGTADYIIGGWIYMVDGSAAGELHYVTDDDGSGAVTVATAFKSAVAATDKFLFIWPAATNHVRWNATYSGLMSEIDSTACTKHIQGLMHYIQAPGIPLQPLMRDKHDGLVISNARFYHDFLFTGVTDLASGSVGLVTIHGQAAA